MTLDDLREVQRIDSELLKQIDDICKKNSIQYYLLYGTLLGAVRHRGPIPWDDDVDIGMTRENYVRFIQEAQKDLSSENVLRIMGSGTLKYVSEVKIGRANTVYCLPGTEDFDIMNMVQLDIFLLDYLKKPNKVRAWVINKLKLIKLNWDEKRLMLFCLRRSSKHFKTVYRIMIYLSHLLRTVISEKSIEHIIYNLAVDKTGTSQYIGSALELDTGYYDVSWFANSCELEYDGMKLQAPIGYKKILTKDYGEYMKEPDDDKKYRNNFSEWVFKYK